MIGQGRPKASQGRRLPAARVAAAGRVCRCVLAVTLLALLSHASWADDMRVRIAWGGGPERVWRGTIAVSEGLLSEPRSLGIEADEPGSMWLDGDAGESRKLVIQQRSPRGYDGVELLVAAPSGAKLLVQLSAADDLKQAAVIIASFVYNAAMRDEMMPRKPIRPEEFQPPEPESGEENKGEPAPSPANPVNPATPPPSGGQQPPKP